MSDDILAAATAALRTESDRDAGMAAEATRFRLRRSLAERTRTRRRASVIGVVFAILFGSTVTWAWSTGRVQSAWRAATGPAPTPVAESVAIAPLPARARANVVAPPARVEIAPPVEIAPAIETGVVAVAPTAVEPVTPRAPVKPRRVEPAAPVVEDVIPPPTQPPVTAITPIEPAEPAQSPEIEALYRTAHELHFRGGDAAKALAAWDAYLAAEPSGRFLVEAKYNRAIVLVKLKRYDEAKSALGPFARGEVKPSGYRQAEAKALLDRIAAMNGSNGSGH
jgi:hypothetical protein